jgi:hypothetical protein
MKTIVITLDHEGDLPEGLLNALEARAYDYIQAEGGYCLDVKAVLKPLPELPVVDMEASE